MALKRKITDAIKKARPFLMQVSEDASADTALKELEAVLQALETHKGSADHDNDPHNWSAPNEFAQAVKVAGLLPKGETADIGTPTGIFRIAYISELVTFLLRRENVLVMDGTMVITKQSGKFPSAVASTDTQIDFGQNLTVGDFLLLRAEGQQEYMRVGTKVSGTTYNVTRNLDGTGADSWPAQSVYFVRGHQGDGWLELTATDDQRFSVFVQGVNWNNTTEIGRFGKLDGWQGAGLTGYGIAIGDYANNQYMVYDTHTNEYFVSGKMRAANGNVFVDNDGITVKQEASSISFLGPALTLLARIRYKTYQGNPYSGDLILEGLDKVLIQLLRQDSSAKIEINSAEIKLFHPVRLCIDSPYLKLNNAEIKTTPSPNAIPKADATGKLDAGWLPTTPDPTWTAWTPSVQGWSSTGLTRNGHYKIVGDTLFWRVYINGVSNSTSASFTLPLSEKTLTGTNYWWTGTTAAVDNGVNQPQPGRWQIRSNSSTVSLYKNMAAASWTASGNKVVIAEGFIGIQSSGGG